MNSITVLIMYFILIILEPSFLILYIYMVNTLSYYYSTFVILSVYSIILKPAQNLNNDGITNNASESINAVLHSLQNWKQVPLDVFCVS